MAAMLLGMLILAFVYFAWRGADDLVEGGRAEDTAESRPISPGGPGGLDLGRLRRDMAVAAGLRTAAHFSPEPPATGPEPLADRAEEHEATLSRQLLDGTIDCATYRAQMRDLAQDSRRIPGSE